MPSPNPYSSAKLHTDEDRRPRHVRYALQMLMKGYRLTIDLPTGAGYWRHPQRSSNGCTLSMALQIAEDLPEEEIAVIMPDGSRKVARDLNLSKLRDAIEQRNAEQRASDPEPNAKAETLQSTDTDEEEPMTETETTKAVTLDKPHYTSREIGQMTGYSDSWAHVNKDRLTRVEQEDGSFVYLVDQKLTALLTSRGFDVEASLPLPENGENDLGDQVDPSGDGYDGEAYLLEVDEAWEPTRENIGALPKPLRAYLERMAESLVEAQEKYDTLEQHLLDASEKAGADDLKDPVVAVGYLESASETAQKYHQIDALLKEAFEEHSEKAYPGAFEAVTYFLEELDAENSASNELRTKLQAARRVGEELSDQLAGAKLEIINLKAEVEPLKEKLKRDVEHAHAKGRADEAYRINRLYEAEPEADVHVPSDDPEPIETQTSPVDEEIDKLFEVAKQLNERGDNRDAPRQVVAMLHASPLALVKHTFRKLQDARVSGDDKAVADAKERFDHVCAAALKNARQIRRTVWKAASSDLLNRVLPV